MRREGFGTDVSVDFTVTVDRVLPVERLEERELAESAECSERFDERTMVAMCVGGEGEGVFLGSGV